MNHEKLRKYRMSEGYTQTEFSKIIGYDRARYNQIENGKVEPTMKLLNKIAEALGRNMKDFF